MREAKKAHCSIFRKRSGHEDGPPGPVASSRREDRGRNGGDLRPHGALEAFVEARDKGLVRFIGVTGHHDPLITRRCLQRFDFDTVLIPVNPAEPAYKSYLTEVIPQAKKKGMGIVGMKVYFRGFADRLPWFETMEPFSVLPFLSRSRLRSLDVMTWNSSKRM